MVEGHLPEKTSAESDSVNVAVCSNKTEYEKPEKEKYKNQRVFVLTKRYGQVVKCKNGTHEEKCHTVKKRKFKSAKYFIL